MKAAVFRTVHQPLTIEDVDISARAPRGLRADGGGGRLPQRRALPAGSLPRPTPIVLGHESAGIVAAVGSEVRYVQPGDHVITCLSVFCGHCNYCTTGRPHLCNRVDTMRRADEPHGSHNAGK